MSDRGGKNATLSPTTATSPSGLSLGCPGLRNKKEVGERGKMETDEALSRSRKRNSSSVSIGTLLEYITPSLWVLYGVLLLEIAGCAYVQSGMQHYFKTELGMDALAQSSLFTAYQLSQVAGALFCGRISDAYGRRPLLIVAFLISGVALVGLGLASSYWTVLIVRASAGLSGGSIAVTSAYVLDGSTEANKGYRLGGLGASVALGFSLGSFLQPPLSKHLSFFHSSFLGGGICLVAALLSFFFLSESLKETYRRPLTCLSEVQQGKGRKKARPSSSSEIVRGTEALPRPPKVERSASEDPGMSLSATNMKPGENLSVQLPADVKRGECIEEKGSISRFELLREILGSTSVSLVCLSRFASAFAMQGAWANHYFVVTEVVGGSNSTYAAISGASGLQSIFTMALIYPLVEKRGHFIKSKDSPSTLLPHGGSVLGHLCAALGLGTYILLSEEGLGWHCFAACLVVVGGSCIEPGYPSILALYVTPRRLGVANGLVGAAKSLGGAMGPLLAGWLWRKEYRISYLPNFFFMALAAAIIACLGRWGALKKEEEEEDEEEEEVGSW